MIQDYRVTPANVHDSQVFGVLLDTETTDAQGKKCAVYTDSAYRSQKHEAHLKEQQLDSQIRSTPLTDAHKASNRQVNRAGRVEHIFGAQAAMGGQYVRTTGLARGKVKIGLMNLTYNMRCLDLDVRQLPLCVDLDGTLINSDLLLEATLSLIKINPFYVLLLPLWLLQGKSMLKAEIAKRITLNPSTLPFNKSFLSWLKYQQTAGRSLWLCTASNYRLAQQVAEYLGIFSGIIASTDTQNLSGIAKAKYLVEKFGVKQFDYCGNHRVDLAIWSFSEGAVIVNGAKSLKQSAAMLCIVLGVFPKSTRLLPSIFKALRPHQWAKNVLVFIPLVTAHKLNNVIAIEQAFIAFFSFVFCASSVYLLNDMLDLEVDRQHPRKCKRPFAAGDLSLLVGFLLVPVLLAVSIALASRLSEQFGLTLACYYVLTVAYSFSLKHVVLVDVISLAALYTVRIIAGSIAIAVSLSFWLLLFSVFLFFSLALVKRYAELDAMKRLGRLNAAGRGYHINDLSILYNFGTASGYLSVLIMALYINSPAVHLLYRHPETIWLLCILLLHWISRIWLKTHRGQMHDDPVVFALKDRMSLGAGILIASILILAI